MTHVKVLVLHESLFGKLGILVEDTPISWSTELHPSLVDYPSYSSAMPSG